MEFKLVMRAGTLGLLLAAAGCYEYPPAPTSTMGDTYTLRQQDGADRLLDGISALTLADAQQIAIKNNPTYIAAYHAVNAARMRYLQAWGAYSPTIGATFSMGNTHNWTRNTKNMSYDGAPTRTQTFSTNTGISANWLLFDGLAREFTVKIYEHNYDYQKQLEEDEARSMMRAVAYAYNTVLLAIENRRIAEEDSEFQQSSLRDTQLKYEAGTVPLSDVLNFEIAANSAESNKITADYQYEVAIYALAVLMGYPEGSFPKDLRFPSDFKTNFSELPATDIYLDTALANRPDLKAYREQLEIAKYQMYQTWSTYSPTVNAYFNFGYGTSLNHHRSGWEGMYGSNRAPGNTYSESPSMGYGLTADWMIFNGLIRENKIREYKANLAVAEFSAAAKWLEVISEVRTAYANYAQSVRQTRLFEKTRDLSAQQRDLVDEGYKAGNTELTRLNEAQRDLVEAETNLASSYINIQNAKAQLDAAVGMNSAAYYGDPERVSPGVLQNTPVANGEEKPAQPAAENTAVAKTEEAGAVVVEEPVVPADGAKAPPIPADPTKAPETK